MGMGVDESDISTEGIIGKERSGATNKKLQASGKLGFIGTKKPDERGHLTFTYFSQLFYLFIS